MKNNLPLGGQWNYDSANRNPYNGKVKMMEAGSASQKVNVLKEEAISA